MTFEERQWVRWNDKAGNPHLGRFVDEINGEARVEWREIQGYLKLGPASFKLVKAEALLPCSVAPMPEERWLS